MSIEDVVKGYTEALLWVNTYHYVIPSDDDSMEMELQHYASAHVEFKLADFDEFDRGEIMGFVEEFVEENRVFYDAYVMLKGGGPAAESLFGHDLLLTRSGHGAGFWDRGLGELGDRLSDAARVYGSTSAEVVDGKPVLVES